MSDAPLLILAFVIRLSTTNQWFLHMADIAERIAAARKEAEVLKEKIKAKKDSLADTTCKSSLDRFKGHISHCFNSDFCT